jgi:2-polyprenyl-6-methoxyphenol hydroxylase-like FAD-dependent oxidoreductase
MRDLDPFFLQGSCSKTDAVFLWFSFLTAPGDVPLSSNEANGANTDAETKERRYYCQVMTSWPYRPGFLGHDKPTEMPETKAEQLELMKSLTQDWTEPFKSIVCNIPEDSEVMPIYLADWQPRRTTAFEDGRVVLLGDAAHTMVMYRGEGANHSIVDVQVLLNHFQPVVEAGGMDGETFKEAREAYENEMVERTEIAVLASRRACMDAHEWERLNDKSPLVRRRLMRADFEEVVDKIDNRAAGQ